ncbi:MAG: MFS transporter [Caldilineaceae bacterium]|nr:MFS transporter [Caldilineaceae bacterium]
MSLLWLLALVLFLMGIGEGGVDVGGNVLLVWIHRSRVGPYMNGLHFFFGVGAFVAPIIVAQMVLLSGGITAAYWVLALLIFPISLWLMRLPSPPRQQATRGGAAVTVNVPLTTLIAVFMFLYVAAEVSFGGWIYTYAVALDLTSPTTAAYLTSVFWGALTVGRLAAVPIAARYRPRTILAVDLVGCLASVGLILLFPASMTAVWIGTFGYGFAMASIFPTVISWAERRMALSGSITSVFLVGASLGAMTFPLLIGQLFDARGPQVVMVMVFGLLVVEFAMFGVLMAVGGPPTMDDEDEESESSATLIMADPPLAG